MYIYTAQYRYSGPDRFDVTVKGQDPLGKFFAPTWDMVMGVKNGTMSHYDYSMKYAQIVVNATSNKDLLARIQQRFSESVTLVCFCRAGEFCHRYLLAPALAAALGSSSYEGER